jgi:hypothetical protein
VARRGRRRARRAPRALGRQPDRASLQPPARAGSRGVREAPRAVRGDFARCGPGSRQGGARLWRRRLPRHHQPAPRSQGGRGRGRWPDRGVRRRRRARRRDQSLRPRERDQAILRRHAAARRRHQRRTAGGGRIDDGRRPRLARQPLHRHAREPGARGLQADDARCERRGHRVHRRGIGRPANFLKSSLEAGGFDVAELAKRGLGTGKLKDLGDEAKAWKTIWSAGQGVGTIRDLPGTAELCARLKAEFDAARATGVPWPERG